VFDQTFDPIMINGTNLLGSIGCSMEHLILSRSIKHLNKNKKYKTSIIINFSKCFNLIGKFVLFKRN
jgi:hypothetical protein